jgi:aspartate/methionine/tyrosine aminotransferase
MAWNGPAALVASALERLEIIADTYLSVATPVQVAAGRLLALGAGVRRQIADRIARNLAALQSAAAAAPACRVLLPEAGWSAVVQAPAVGGDDDLALRLLDEADVLVHPGYFFDFPRDGFLVVSLLVGPAEFQAAAARLFQVLGRL